MIVLSKQTFEAPISVSRPQIPFVARRKNLKPVSLEKSLLKLAPAGLKQVRTLMSPSQIRSKLEVDGKSGTRYFFQQLLDVLQANCSDREKGAAEDLRPVGCLKTKSCVWSRFICFNVGNLSGHGSWRDAAFLSSPSEPRPGQIRSMPGIFKIRGSGSDIHDNLSSYDSSWEVEVQQKTRTAREGQRVACWRRMWADGSLLVRDCVFWERWVSKPLAARRRLSWTLCCAVCVYWMCC